MEFTPDDQRYDEDPEFRYAVNQVMHLMRDQEELSTSDFVDAVIVARSRIARAKPGTPPKLYLVRND